MWVSPLLKETSLYNQWEPLYKTRGKKRCRVLKTGAMGYIYKTSSSLMTQRTLWKAGQKNCKT